MTVSFRPRTTADDLRSIRRLKYSTSPVPLPTKIPIVSWDRPIAEEELGPKFIDDNDQVLRCCTWPSSTNLLCHNCCYSFEGVPVPLPQSYDGLRKVYHCRGNFCSWQCAKSYNMRQTPPSGRGNRNMYIALLAHRTWVKYRRSKFQDDTNEPMKTYATYCIHPSPPREVLDVFGGSMTIEEYRKGLFGIVPPSEATVKKPFLTIRQKLMLPFLDTSKKESNRQLDVGSSRQATQKIDTSTVHRHSNAFCEKLNKAKSDRSIMKRKREDTSKNTLMSTMGVVIKRKYDES